MSTISTTNYNIYQLSLEQFLNLKNNDELSNTSVYVLYPDSVADMLKPKSWGTTISANNKFTFSNISADMRGLVIFITGVGNPGNCMNIINLYNIQSGTTYKQVGTFVYDDSDDLIVTTTINYKLTGTTLEIWSDDLVKTVANGYNGTLYGLKLY